MSVEMPLGTYSRKYMGLPSDILMLEAWQESEGAAKLGMENKATTNAKARRIRIMRAPFGETVRIMHVKIVMRGAPCR